MNQKPHSGSNRNKILAREASVVARTLGGRGKQVCVSSSSVVLSKHQSILGYIERPCLRKPGKGREGEGRGGEGREGKNNCVPSQIDLVYRSIYMLHTCAHMLVHAHKQAKPLKLISEYPKITE